MPLSEELRARITAEFPKYPEKRAVLLSALHFIQAECEGWIPPDTIGELADILELPRIDVEEVISFYPMYHTERVGRCHLQVCTNLPCCLAGARAVVRALEAQLDLVAGEVSSDGLFSLGEAECLGSCGTAPMMQVGDEYYENLDEASVDRILNELK